MFCCKKKVLSPQDVRPVIPTARGSLAVTIPTISGWGVLDGLMGGPKALTVTDMKLTWNVLGILKQKVCHLACWAKCDGAILHMDCPKMRLFLVWMCANLNTVGREGQGLSETPNFLGETVISTRPLPCRVN